MEEIWYTKPDDERTPWVFLTLRFEKDETKWCIGYANSTKMVKIVKYQGGNELEALQQLLGEVQKCKRNTLLITPDFETLVTLRRKLLSLDQKHPSLRGLRHVCIKEILDKYFGGSLQPKSESPIHLWELLTKIGPLVPERALKGEPL